MDRAVETRPNYAARRLAALLLVISGVVVGGWLVGQFAAGFAAQPASAAAPGGDTGAGSGFDVHVARSGDTLWSIAEAHRGEVGRGRYIDALVVLNGSTGVEVGQAVHLPRTLP